LFQFNIWQYGKWMAILVDDYLPVLDGHWAFCPPLGWPGEFWGPLIEKAYAKCHKAYEVIESGDPLDALTDLTGAICEHFMTSEPPEVLFNILLTSHEHKSVTSCYRKSETQSDKSSNNKNSQYLYLVCGVTS
ncbi:calpain-A-like, partial [Lingula anatina]